MHNVITLPIWLMGDHAEVILRALLAPLSDPRGWSDSMGSPGCRLMLAGLSGVLAAVWAWGRRGPPEGDGKFLPKSSSRTAASTRVYRAPAFPKNTMVNDA